MVHSIVQVRAETYDCVYNYSETPNENVVLPFQYVRVGNRPSTPKQKESADNYKL